jgi:hypothetical protein
VERELDGVADGGPCSDFCRACCLVCRGMGGTGCEYSMAAKEVSKVKCRRSNQKDLDLTARPSV